MQPDNVALGVLGHILANLVTALGMKAANEERLSKGYSIAYDEQAFEDVATRMRSDAEWLVGSNR